MSFRVKFYSYTGDHTFYCVPTEMAECRKFASQLIARHRNHMKYPVETLERGRKWELMTGEDAGFIGWGEGVVKIVQACGMCEKEIADSPGDDDLCDPCQEAEDEAYDSDVDAEDDDYCEDCGVVLDWSETKLCGDCEVEDE